MTSSRHAPRAARPATRVQGGRACLAPWHPTRRGRARAARKSPPTHRRVRPCGRGRDGTVTDVLKHAGFGDLELKRQDLSIKIGDDLEHAVSLVMSIGPAGEVLRLWGDRVDEIRPKVPAALREGMADLARDDAVYADSSTWSIRAVAPG